MLASVSEVTDTHRGRTAPGETYLKLPEVIPKLYTHIGVSKYVEGVAQSSVHAGVGCVPISDWRCSSKNEIIT